MTSKTLAVFAYLPNEKKAVPSGLLTMEEEGTTLNGAVFAYGIRYIERKNAVEVDPVSLSLRGDDVVGGVERHPAHGLSLFGAIRDASPDSWGRRVIESRRKVPLNSLPESEYLLAAGSNRVGALDIRTDIKAGEAQGGGNNILQLQYFLEAANRIEEGLPVPADLEAYYDAGTALGGARPKATVTDAHGKVWLAKLPSTKDVYDIPLIEVATLKLAQEAGLTVPMLDVVRLAGKKKVMLIERFDRVGTGEKVTRRHFVSALTLIGCHEQDSPKINYADIADRFRQHGAANCIVADIEELFGRMVFNILVSNDDDHLRNHGFLWNADARGWELSPLYDVVPKPSHATERYLHLGVGQQGRLATLTNALSWSSRFGLTQDKAIYIVDRIWRVVREWKERFEEWQVPPNEIEKISSAFRHAREIGGREIGLL